jgi:hypothetical protein
MANFQSGADVQAWVNLRGFDGERALRKALDDGTITGRNAALARVYLSEKDKIQDLQQRDVAAAEKGADAAVDALEHAKRSADAAVSSARWAMWATAIAAVALIVAAWPFIKDLGR